MIGGVPKHFTDHMLPLKEEKIEDAEAILVMDTNDAMAMEDCLSLFYCVSDLVLVLPP